jgi:predicted short-subunit dehydrogenase-like oxidoreductase (DUF2520 family)
MLGRRELAPLAEKGAATGSFWPLEGIAGKRIVAEGAGILAGLRLLLAGSGLGVVEVRDKALYAAGLTFATALFLPALAASAECLRAAGMKPAQAEDLARRAVENSVRAYLKARRKAWGGLQAIPPPETANRHAQALRRMDARLAAYYQAALACAAAMANSKE